MTCKVDGCSSPAYARGYCIQHYHRVLRHGDPSVNKRTGPRPRRPRAICTIEGCDQPAKAHGWCVRHYFRWRDHGDPLVVEHPPQPNPAEPAQIPCSVEGCNRPHVARGYCRRHYDQWRRGRPFT